MIKKLPVFLLFFTVFGIGQLQSQCSMVEVPLLQRIQNSTMIIEGKVLSQYSFWNTAHTRIYTSNTIQVYKVFKGIVTGTTVQLITEGGEVGNQKHVIEPSLNLKQNEMGVFFIHQPTIADLASGSNLAYADAQGFAKYDVNTGFANDPFKKYSNIETELHNVIIANTGVRVTVKQNFVFQSNAGQAKSLSSIQSISSFSPTSITAGTHSVLTINGSGFGSTQGTSVVQFKNADDGGSTYIQPAPSHYLLWSDTQIQVVVPAKTSISGSAGTGTIQVIVNSNTTTSSGTLTVNYNELNLASSGNTYQTDHVNESNNGGYNWQMYTGFDSNAPAKAAFIRAFTNWRCNTYINWQLSNTLTSINTIANDGTDVIRFDIGSELPVGVLGRCSSYWSSCATGVWYVNELDIVFDDATTWNYTTSQPSVSESDFESVALHELGHGHQLGHVINTNDVMNYALTVGTSRRVLSADNLNAGNDVMSRNVVNNSCGPTHMIALTSGNCAVGAPSAAFTASPINSCSVPTTVTFTDQTTGGPTSWAWDVNNDGTVDYTTQSPSHTYNTAGTYTVKLIVTNGNGSDTLIKTNYITVGSASLPFTENFESSTFPPTGWTISQTPSDIYTWERDSIAAGNGSSTGCAAIRYFNYNINTGAKDALVSGPINLTGVTTAKLKYKFSYKYYSNPANYDSLRIFISTDCGSTFGNAIKTYGGPSLATNGSDANEFEPSVTADWKTDSVALNSYVGGSIVVKFEGTNRYGNDLYLDDINVTGVSTPKPVAAFVASDSIVCVGACVGFTDQSANAPTSWAWAFTGAVTATSSVQNPTNICYNTAGTYAVKLVATNSGGADSVIKTSYIVVDSLPQTPVISQNGNVLTSSVVGTSYQWSLNGTPINGATSVSYSATSAGNYSVIVTNASGCTSTSAPYNFSANLVAANANSELSVLIYPNPFNSVAMLEVKGISALNGELQLFDVLGKMVFKAAITNSKTEIHREQLTEGTYLYKVYNQNQLIGKGKVAIK